MAYGSPDHAEYPAPPIDYLIARIPSMENWENTDLKPEVK